MTTFYNEIDPFAAQWLRNLGAANLIQPGVIDERSIKEVRGADVAGHTRVHFFAGIGGWDYALKLAGWPDDEVVWTGSCPCQPFSAAGKGAGQSDDRHLWPDFFRLIRECRPPTIFGEQVVNAISKGWLDEVFSNLEAEGYACGAAVLPAYAVEAHHEGSRIFFVAEANSQRLKRSGSKLEEKRSESVISSLSTSFSEWADIEKHLPQSVIRAGDDGVPNRVGRLRAYGNAIVPQVAAEFIMAYVESSQSQDQEA